MREVAAVLAILSVLMLVGSWLMSLAERMLRWSSHSISRELRVMRYTTLGAAAICSVASAIIWIVVTR